MIKDVQPSHGHNPQDPRFHPWRQRRAQNRRRHENDQPNVDENVADRSRPDGWGRVVQASQSILLRNMSQHRRAKIRLHGKRWNGVNEDGRQRAKTQNLKTTSDENPPLKQADTALRQCRAQLEQHQRSEVETLIRPAVVRRDELRVSSCSQSRGVAFAEDIAEGKEPCRDQAAVIGAPFFDQVGTRDDACVDENGADEEGEEIAKEDLWHAGLVCKGLFCQHLNRREQTFTHFV